MANATLAGNYKGENPTHLEGIHLGKAIWSHLFDLKMLPDHLAINEFQLILFFSHSSTRELHLRLLFTVLLHFPLWFSVEFKNNVFSVLGLLGANFKNNYWINTSP